MRRILLGVCGSVAAYKSAELVRLLKRDYAVQPMMSEAAGHFIGAATLRALSGVPVAIEEWKNPLSAHGMDHIALPREADGFLIAPASADFIAKAAAGFADNLLLSSFLAADCPRWIAPAMNQQMWAAATTQRNIRQLVEDGVEVLPPAEGEQACGEVGEGRMMAPEDIATFVRAYFSSPLSGRRAVVSVGATVEKIDDMRIIGNVSSGKMGFYVAQALKAAGAEVMLVAGQTTVPSPPLPIRRATSVEEMRVAVLEECRNADIFVSVAAVSDFTPKTRATGKIPRQKGGIVLELVPTSDILSTVTQKYPQLFAVGFAAESGTDAVRAAKAKMRRKKTAMVVCNPAQDAGGDDAELTIITGNGESQLPRQHKRAAANAVVAAIAEEIVSRETWREAK